MTLLLTLWEHEGKLSPKNMIHWRTTSNSTIEKNEKDEVTKNIELSCFLINFNVTSNPLKKKYWIYQL